MHQCEVDYLKCRIVYYSECIYMFTFFLYNRCDAQCVMYE